MTTFDLNFADDHFTLFGLPQRQGIEQVELDARFRDVQAKVHPDRHAHAGDADQRLSMQWATRVNEAYQTLKAPLARARYLLHLRGVDVQLENNTAMPMEFLVAQMEARESVAEARAAGDEAALDDVRGNVLRAMKAEQQRLRELLDESGDNAAAGALVRQMMFQEKLLQEIDDALEAVAG